MSEPMSTPTTGLLASPADLAERLHVDAADAGLLLALRRASSRLEGAIGYPVLRVDDDVVTLTGDGSRRLLLPARPVVAVTSVVVDGAALIDADYTWSRWSGIMRRAAGHVWPDELDVVEVTYTHGWDVVPGDIQDAVLEQAEQTYNVEPAIASRGSGSESVAYLATASTGVTQRWVDVVDRYRLAGDDA